MKRSYLAEQSLKAHVCQPQGVCALCIICQRCKLCLSHCGCPPENMRRQRQKKSTLRPKETV